MMYLITTILETNLLVNIQFKIINQLNNFMFFFTSTNFVYGFIKIEFHCFRNRYCNCQKKNIRAFIGLVLLKPKNIS